MYDRTTKKTTRTQELMRTVKASQRSQARVTTIIIDLKVPIEQGKRGKRGKQGSSRAKRAQQKNQRQTRKHTHQHMT